VLRRGWVFFVPIGVLVYTLLVLRWPAGKAGMSGVLAGLAASLVYAESRIGLHGIVTCLRATGRTLLPLVAISALAGIVIGALQLSGLTFKFSLVLSAVGGDHLLLMLVLTAIVCIVLGLGMPTTVIYVMLAVLIAPALIELGVRPMAAHLFIFYFGMLSMITPPVCVATYTAASLAEANFWRAGGLGVRLGIVAYIVPFLFVFHPALLLDGDAVQLIVTTASALLAVCLIAVGLVGYLFAATGFVLRGLFVAAGLMLFFPPSSNFLLAVNACGVVLAALLVLRNHRSRAVSARAGAA